MTFLRVEAVAVILFPVTFPAVLYAAYIVLCVAVAFVRVTEFPETSTVALLEALRFPVPLRVLPFTTIELLLPFPAVTSLLITEPSVILTVLPSAVVPLPPMIASDTPPIVEFLTLTVLLFAQKHVAVRADCRCVFRLFFLARQP